VKHLRIIILVMLSILLPIRGAVAATMLCPDGEGTGTVAVAAGQDDHAMHADHQMHADHHHALEEAPGTDTTSADHPATCHFCASGCCMASMVGTVPSVAEPSLTTSVVFPALSTRIPAFQSDGQERPPRTI
jgi:hydroxyethylthiazole kinase-like sugar kinase family protein